jgi:hypothetical protein
MKAHHIKHNQFKKTKIKQPKAYAIQTLNQISFKTQIIYPSKPNSNILEKPNKIKLI